MRQETPRSGRTGIARLVAIAAIAWYAGPLAAGPWTAAEDQTSLTLMSAWSNFDTVEIFDSREMFVGRIRFSSFLLTVAHGVSDDLEASFTLPYVSSSHEMFAAGATEAFGDASGSLKYRFLDEREDRPLTMAFSLGVKTPLSDYRTDSLAALGDDQTDLELRLSAGRFFEVGRRSGYASLEAGYRRRFAGETVFGLKTPDEDFAILELGLSPLDRLLTRAFVSAVDPHGGLGLESPLFVQAARAIGEPPFPLVAEEWVKGGLGATYSIKPDVSLDAFWTTTLSKKNTSQEDSYGISTTFRFDPK